MVDRDDTRTKVISIVASTLNVSKEDVQESKSFEELGADSLDRLEMIMKFEETFGIDISDEKEAQIKTIGQAIDEIQTVRTK